MATPDSLDKELNKITQTTGFIAGGGLDTLKGRISSQIRTTRDIASLVHQLNVVYYNIVRTLTDGRDTGRENVLEVGIAGTNIICYQDAAQGSCYWADLLEKPATIKEVFDCCLARISSLENALSEEQDQELYDDTELTARLDCVELNLLQIMKDTLGSGTYGCDGSNDFIYSLSSMINALGSNFDGFTPIHVEHSEEGTPGPYTLSTYSSQIIWDVAVSQVNVEDLPANLACIHDAIGMSTADDCSNDFSTEAPSPASAGNNVVADGDSLRQAVKALDSAAGGGNAWSQITFSSSGSGVVAGGPQIAADNAGDLIDFRAGNGIRIDNNDDPEGIEWSVHNYSLQDAYSYGNHGLISLNNTYPVNQQGLSLRDNVVPIDGPVLQAGDNAGSKIYFELGKHENYNDSVDYLTYRADLEVSPLYFKPQEYVPGTTGPALAPPFNNTERGAVWVSSGTAAYQDKFGNDLVADHIYFREPSQGIIHDLTCCYYLAQGHETEDPANPNEPFETVELVESPGVDTRLNRANPNGVDPFLTYREHNNHGGQVHYSIEVIDPTGNDTSGLDGANYVAVNHHSSPTLMSKLTDISNIPETHVDQGALFIPHDGTTYNQTPVNAGRLYYRAPNNGDIYDLTSGVGGGAQNVFSSFSGEASNGTFVDNFPVKTSATGDLHFHNGHPADGEQVTIVDTNGLVKVYTGSVNGTDDANGIFSVQNAQDAIDGLDDCIVHANGHNGSISTNQPTNDRLVLTQQPGVTGNTNIAHNFSSPGVTVTSFTGGSSYDTASSPSDTFSFVAGDHAVIAGFDGGVEIGIDLSNLNTVSLNDVSGVQAVGNQALVYDAQNSEYNPRDFYTTTVAGYAGVELTGAPGPQGGNTIKALNSPSGSISILANGNNADLDIDIGTLNIGDLSDVAAVGLSAEDALMWTGVEWTAVGPSIYRRGGLSVGTGESLIKQVTDAEIEFKSLKTNTVGMSITSTADEVYIDYAGGGGGGGGGESLSQTLAIANDTGGNNVVFAAGDEIQGTADLVLKVGDNDINLIASLAGEVRVRSGNPQDSTFLTFGENSETGIGFVPIVGPHPEQFLSIGPSGDLPAMAADQNHLLTGIRVSTRDLSSIDAGFGMNSGRIVIGTGQTSTSGQGTIPGESGILAMVTGNVTGDADSGAAFIHTGASTAAESGMLLIQTGQAGSDSGLVTIASGDAQGGSSGSVTIATGASVGGVRGRAIFDTQGIDITNTSPPLSTTPGVATLFVADNSDPSFNQGGIYYRDGTTGQIVDKRIDLASMDTEHINMPEAPNDTVYYYGWANRDCILDTADAFSAVVATVGTYTLVVEKKDGVNWNTMLSAANFDMTSLSALTVSNLALTGIAGDLEFSANDVWRIGVTSNDVGLDAEGVYVKLTFKAV